MLISWLPFHLSAASRREWQNGYEGWRNRKFYFLSKE